jgi:hypothetical protein
MCRSSLIFAAFISITALLPLSAYPQTSSGANPGTWARPLNHVSHSDPALIGDYVPCIFDLDQQGTFRAIKVPNLDQEMRDAAKNALDFTELPENVKDTLKRSFDSVSFVGQPPQTIYENVKELAVTQQIASAKADATTKGEIYNLDSSQQATLVDKANKAAQTVTTVATQAASLILRPSDVSCGIAILPWSITRWNFGREVSENFIAVQVTVRNLNDNEQFLVHDVELAVDTKPGLFNRFNSGVDQTTVHGVAATAEEGVESRTFWLRLATFVGSVASAATVAVSADAFRQAVGAYQGGLIPGLNKFLKDHTEEQISRLDATAFTNAQSKKIIVPKNDSATFYTFLPAKPFLQIDWDQIYKYKIGDAAISATSLFLLDKEKSYKKWTPIAVQGFENSTYVIVAGAHIKETTDHSTLSSIACPPGNDAKIDLSKIPGDTTTCTLKGNNLGLLAQVILENATDTSDKRFATGTVSVNGGDTTQATVTFTSKDLAALTGNTYKIYFSTKGGSPQASELTVTLQRTVVSLAPATLAFDDQTVNVESAAKTVKLTNTGSKNLTVKSTKSTGSNASDFDPQNDCTSPLKTGDHCTITVKFKPGAVGDRTASLSIEDDASDSPQTMTLTGKGLAASTTPSPVNLSSKTLAFGSQGINTSVNKTIKLTNAGKTTLSIKSIESKGKDAASFLVTNNCNSPLKPADSCTITVKFTPNTAGNYAASISIADDAPDTPQSADLKGTGITAPTPALKLNSKSLVFAPQKTNTEATKQITLTNTENAPLTIKSVSIVGAEFEKDDRCGTTLPAKLSCNINVTFKPKTTGKKTATLTIDYDAAGSPQTLSLSGTAN